GSRKGSSAFSRQVGVLRLWRQQNRYHDSANRGMLLMSRESCRCRYHLRPVLPHPAPHRQSQGHALPFLRKRHCYRHQHKGRSQRNLLSTAVMSTPNKSTVPFWEAACPILADDASVC